ncbi:NADH-quinone oxidoreductase subunit NuoE [Microbaculum marinum]|uniref:NADH-quinone oxidoreductase subunit NuoE n=1 Tax=Microbaculum marinum TaxID=1764581 RepID=A0AAW9S513_9HYPH
MSVRRLWHEQPDGFAFSADNAAWVEKAIKRYPEGRQASAVIPLLWKAQEQEGWVSEPAIRHVADMLDMPYIRVLEVATFYTMFQLRPVGTKAHVQVCGTTPCMLRGAGDLIAVCKRRIAEHAHDVSEDGAFSWEEVECLGACVNAPMIQVFKDTYEDLTAESFEAILDAFDAGETPAPGPQNGRHYSAPLGGAKVLKGDPGPATPTREAAAEKVDTPDADVDPATPKARHEYAAKPSGEDTAEAEVARSASNTDEDSSTAGAVPEQETRPPGLDAPRDGKPDDLTKIAGIGPRIESTLHSIGVYHFEQIAAWTPAEVAWVNGHLNFKGRIDRDDWIVQATNLAGKDGAASSAPTGKRT